MTPQAFAADLATIPAMDDLTVRICSGGGDVWAAQAIGAMLENRLGTVTAQIEGICASAATIVASHCKVVKAAEDATYMIHPIKVNPNGFVDMEGLKQLMDALTVMRTNVLNQYAKKTGHTVEEVAAWMDATSWWTAAEAKENVILQAISEEIVPKVSFFKDRYFPTGAGDIFKANEVLTEYRSGDRKLAAFVDQKAGDIPIGRRSYEVHSYKPAYIAPSRLLTLDELTKRGFGEALYPGMDEAQRAARLLADDMNDMENRIARREEWMAAETMIGNGCVMQEYIDGATKGDSLVVKFYDGTSDHTYTASKKWNENGGDFWGDVKAMCRMLSARGLPAKDLILGTDVADYILTDERTRQLLDKNSGIIVGEIRQQLTQYDGVVFMGTLNFGGFMLNVFSVDETYEDETGKSARYFPATAAMVTAPDCGHMMYGSITQMDYGKTDYTTYAAKRVAKLVVDQDKDTRKLRLGCRPLAAPKTYCPYIYAADVVG